MPNITRRQALETLGLAVAASALPSIAHAQPTFPKGAIIRTLLKDMDPSELAGGATLFHEHMQLGVDFNQRFSAASAAVRALNAPPANNAKGNDKGNVFRVGGSVTPPGATPPKPGAAKGPDMMRDANLMAAEVAKTKADGIACIVDAGHPDSGRDINFLREVAMKSGVPIVAGGGFYSHDARGVNCLSRRRIFGHDFRDQLRR
jgi:predicted metal-dependent phosphotriesterase family hydrolase